jgi:glycosyltransferase involved in cell wall biosynthesis
MKIVFIQPGYAHYRDKLFDILSKYYQISFLFEKSKRTYPGNSMPKDINFVYANNLFKVAWIGIAYYLIKNRPDIVITSVSTSLRTLITYFYAVMFRKKLILWVLEWKNMSKIKMPKYFYRKIKFIVSCLIIKKSNAVIAGGTASYRFIRFIKKSNNDIFLAFQSTDDLKKLFKNDKKPNKIYTFLYLSRILEFKGLDVLIKSYFMLKKERKNISLLIAGDGPFREYCEKLCKKLKLKDVMFVGSVDPRNLAEFYQKGKVFILPSYFYKNQYEAWGLVINEAMSFGLPIITTNAVGAAYDLVIDGKNGLVIKENNVYELYKGMKKILDMDFIKMGKNSRQIFETKNNYYKMASGFIKAIAHVSSN